MIRTNEYFAENEKGEQTIDHERLLARLWAGNDGKIGQAIGVEEHEVVVPRLVLAELADWAHFDVVEVGDVPDELAESVDQAYEALEFEPEEEV